MQRSCVCQIWWMNHLQWNCCSCMFSCAQVCTSEAKNILVSGKKKKQHVIYRHSINCGYDLALKSFSLWRNPIRCASCCCVVTALDGLRVTSTASCLCLSDITFAIDKGVFGVVGWNVIVRQYSWNSPVCLKSVRHSSFCYDVFVLTANWEIYILLLRFLASH